MPLQYEAGIKAPGKSSEADAMTVLTCQRRVVPGLRGGHAPCAYKVVHTCAYMPRVGLDVEP